MRNQLQITRVSEMSTSFDFARVLAVVLYFLVRGSLSWDEMKRFEACMIRDSDVETLSRIQGMSGDALPNPLLQVCVA